MNEKYFELITTECIGCGHRTQHDYCDRYREPYRQWTRVGGCSMRTHGRTKQLSSEKQLNPLKASKRAVGGVK